MFENLTGRLVADLEKAIDNETAPSTDIKFGVHNHYKDNSESIGDIKHPTKDGLFDGIEGINVMVTDQGLVIFNLDKKLDIKEKVDLAMALDDLLKKKLGVGLSFATCGLSAFVKDHELQPYYNAMKLINSNMITIYTDMKPPGEDELTAPKGLVVDHLVDRWAKDPDTATIIAGIVNPNGEGKTEPPEGWDVFEERLKRLYQRAEIIAPQLLELGYVPDLSKGPF